MPQEKAHCKFIKNNEDKICLTVYKWQAVNVTDIGMKSVSLLYTIFEEDELKNKIQHYIVTNNSVCVVPNQHEEKTISVDAS